MIDEQILPEALYTATQTRFFKSEACALISFYFRAANRLTSEERQMTITRASESTPEPHTIHDELLTIDLSSFPQGSGRTAGASSGSPGHCGSGPKDPERHPGHSWNARASL
jgi:hypothetical protein